MLAPWALQRSSSHASVRELEGMEACKDLYVWVILPGVIAHVTWRKWWYFSVVA